MRFVNVNIETLKLKGSPNNEKRTIVCTDLQNIEKCVIIKLPTNHYILLVNWRN